MQGHSASSTSAAKTRAWEDKGMEGELEWSRRASGVRA